MQQEIFQTYRARIAEQGLVAIGRVKNLDDIATERDGKLGIGMECLDRDLWEYEPVLPEIKKLGIHMARIQSGWQKTETKEGIYDFEWLDRLVDDLLENGIQPLLCLCYGNKLYCDHPEEFPSIDRGGVGHFPIHTQRERTGWLNYVEQTVKHFKDRVRYFEIWNEPDVSAFLVTHDIWCDTYAEFVKMTAPVIRKNAPDGKILSCTAGLDNGEALLSRGVADYVDIHSFHGYNAWPELCLGDQINTMTFLKQKYPHLSIWRGEAGFPSYNDPRSKGALSDRVVSENMQAKFILRHIVCDMSNNLLDKTFYFHAYDFEHFLKIVRYHYGVLRHEEPRRKPSYYALQMLAHLFRGKVTAKNDSKIAVAKDYRPFPDDGMSDSEKVAMQFFTFQKGEETFFSYCSPVGIGDAAVVTKTVLSLPYAETMKDPVILDPLTREIYPIANPRRFYAPVTDYPMFVVDAKAVSEWIELSGEAVKEATKEDLTQRYEE